MKILVVGCGSIGRRHARNARKLGFEIALCDVNQDRRREVALEVNADDLFDDFNLAARDSDADAAIIATPSHLHVEPAAVLVASGMHIMMEKPLCVSVDEAMRLRGLVVGSEKIFMMAHTYRFRSDWQRLKNLLDTQPIGRVFSAEFFGGWYLPDWHFREDYRREYAAQRSQGGGVTLTSMSHFFDVISWFFGDIRQIVGARMRLGSLEVDVDDAVACTVLTASGVAVTLFEDFLSRCPRRAFRVNGEHGYLEVDFNRRLLRIWDSRARRYLPQDGRYTEQGADLFRILEDGVAYDLDPSTVTFENSGNDAYLAELEHFKMLVSSNRQDPDLDIDSGIKVLTALTSAKLVDWTH